MEPDTRPRKDRLHVYMTPDVSQIAREMAEETDGGNVSRLIQRLIRMEWTLRHLQGQQDQERVA